MRTAFTDLVGTTQPLVGFSRSPGVVAEVSRAGGLGVLAATAYRPDELDAQLTWIEQRTGGAPYGVDLLVPAGTSDAATDQRRRIPQQHWDFVAELLARHDLDPARLRAAPGADSTAHAIAPGGVDELLDVTFAHPVALVANALGPPPPSMVERAHAVGVVVAALVGRREHAERQLAAGVDVLVAQGTEAGGHTGSIATMVLTPEIVALADDVPVLAAGGIASGEQLAAALALGAAGAWCGSVWLATREDITPDPVKRKLLAAGSHGTVRSRTRTGKPARQLRSAWHDAWEAPGAPEPLAMPLQVLLAKDAWAVIDGAAAAGHAGAQELESFFVGQVVGGLAELRPTADVVAGMLADCATRLRALAGLVDVPTG
ncbi:nitronate monooxygenase [Pimelobacter simplex]|uniref:Enoyl-[acyl-carrier-protein] reductase [FMN] n=1 Tax=Nocardioides simplex TaxID=2045 RepID=A0A0A1DS05_NOCSI|nr:nitronate monooxygenase [Pimelobacter simplex]AIY20119.1 Enoyl-[acyl-carrier-protein] reductase [FMN] [Pimelobacter simplex]MCG8152441.1 nitronate monooxygenase [Pimelobacter simplex]GEB14555.1 monooxygenase [Pimelobacter simplex]SFM28284.1 NAD(P)H-dependent flavin oxidoreductase YrpB, nitropropane dioxygenase family [Pimelobacter simplex]